MITQTELGAAALIYPFADRFVEKDSARKSGAVLPCSEIKVDKKGLVATLLAASFWNLREQGHIALEPVEKRVLFMTRRSLRARTTSSGATRPPAAGSIESELLAGIGPDPDKNAVEHVVFRWLGKDAADPFGAALDRVADELSTAGYGTTEHSTGITKQLKGHARFAPDCGRIGTLRPQFDSWAAGWDGFARGETALHADLLERCKTGVSRRSKSSDSDMGSSGGGGSFD